MGYPPTLCACRVPQQDLQMTCRREKGGHEAPLWGADQSSSPPPGPELSSSPSSRSPPPGQELSPSASSPSASWSSPSPGPELSSSPSRGPDPGPELSSSGAPVHSGSSACSASSHGPLMSGVRGREHGSRRDGDQHGQDPRQGQRLERR